LKFAVVLDFVLKLYIFNLAVELVLLPFLAMLAMLAVVAATKDEYKPARKLIDRVTAIIGFGFLIYALLNIIGTPRGFATVQNLEDFSTPIALSLAFLPFVYAAALFMAYEELFVRVGLRIQNK